MTASMSHRLEGLEPNNLLAFMALLGLLKALETQDATLRPRAAWDIDSPPLRPRIFLARPTIPAQIAEYAANGVEALVAAYDFNRKSLDYARAECRVLLTEAAKAALGDRRERSDILAALMSDAAIKDDKDEAVDPTPLCLLFGQGHQYFLDRLSKVSLETAPPPRGKGKNAARLSASECLSEALFRPWHRADSTFSFRWDPEEDVRYALMAGDPTDTAYKVHTQHGANRLAAIGLCVLTLAPVIRAGRVRPSIIGGTVGMDGFSFAWPIWRDPTTLFAIRAMLSHPALREADGVAHLGVDHVMVARRISVGKFMNFSRARALDRSERIHARR